jgi:antitoxin YefM
MRAMSISKDIIPIGQFKTGLSRWFKNVRESGQPLVITQNGKPAGVLLSPAEYDDLVYKKAFLESVQRGIADADSGRLFDTLEVKAEIKKRKK